MKPELAQRIRQAQFPYLEETWTRPKKPTMICLHHTASGPGVDGDLNWWKKDGQPVSTPLIVGRDGIATQIYPSTRWAYTLGLSTLNRKTIEAQTIGLELDNWGHLTRVGDKFYTYTDQEIPIHEVDILCRPWRGMQYFQKYTAEQIETTRLLLEFWGETYGIPLEYLGDHEVFDLTDSARLGKVPGVYTHASYRIDKTDCYPSEALLSMLKSFGCK